MLTHRLVPSLRHQLRSLSRAASSSTSSSSNSPVPAASSTPTPQSPNQLTAWSTNQRQRTQAYQNARFEQTALELQPNPLSAMDLISKEPVRVVHGRKAVCDGGQLIRPWFQMKLIFHVDISRGRASRSPQNIYQPGMHDQFCNSLAHV
jgi:NADH dehydrogenase (ubiquinone) Fe-S protein 6